jgi:hypothetical protein
MVLDMLKLLFLLTFLALPVYGVPPQIRMAIIGNPVVKVDWNDESVKAIADAGYNWVQLNIAWGSRPHGEALNLRDVVSIPGERVDPKVQDRAKEFHKRIALAKKYGLKTLFHFGSPYMWRDPDTGEVKRGGEAFKKPFFDTENPKLVEYETGLLREFRKEFPDADDILVYTYDQDAWQAWQYGSAKFSHGIPLHERLPKYLKKLHEVWTEGRSDHRMWWEPWELSAGQIYKVIPQLPRENFGMICHCNIAEAQIAKPVDLWFKNVARMCQQNGLPMIGEGAFGAMTEETQDLSIPCPRLADQQYLAMANLPGVIGIKEYFGCLPLSNDLNFAMIRARQTHPDASTDELLKAITQRFGPQQASVPKLCDEMTEAMLIYPWEASWMFRLTSHASTDHGWSHAVIRGQMADTPSWNSTRRAMFMKTDDRNDHPDLLEDVQLRCEVAADHFAKGLEISRSLEKDAGEFAQTSKDIDTFLRVARSFALHIRESLVTQMLRQDLEQKRPMNERLLKELGELLKADAENQHGKGRVMEKKAEFEKDPEKFVRTELLPTDKTIHERGVFTVTTR